VNRIPEPHGTPPADSTIHAIVPVYNEAGTIRKVLSVLRQVDCLGEIIVVNDGSTDNSKSEIEAEAEADHRIRILEQPVNRGKGQSILSASSASPASCFLLLDADLYGLKPGHVQELIDPVLDGKADMTIGQFRGGYWRTDFSHWLTPWLSGQRCLRSELLESIPPAAASGYGLETALTIVGGQNGWRWRRVPMLGVWHQPSEKRRGLFAGLGMRTKMYAQIVRAWYLAGGPQKSPRGPRRLAR
jgi:glycosyltransferase involved in cell wall biosynthesis